LHFLAEPYWQAVKAPLQEIIKRNNLTSATNITVQLLGGGSRVPRVQSELSSVHPGISLERQLDASEAFAAGGALYAANLSTMFRLRRFGMIDGSAYSVKLSLEPTTGVPEELEVRRLELGC
jgi:hypoxia up-regulated 1